MLISLFHNIPVLNLKLLRARKKQGVTGYSWLPFILVLIGDTEERQPLYKRKQKALVGSLLNLKLKKKTIESEGIVYLRPAHTKGDDDEDND